MKDFKESKIRKNVLDMLVEDGDLTLIKIEGMNENFYVRTQDIKIFNDDSPIRKVMKFLAPLDNLLWDRKMIKMIFGFEYTWEVYTPAKKRKYGYYVLPVLYADRIVARFEPIIDKENKLLVVKNWWWEDNTKVGKGLLKERERALSRFVKYLGLEGVRDETM